MPRHLIVEKPLAFLHPAVLIVVLIDAPVSIDFSGANAPGKFLVVGDYDELEIRLLAPQVHDLLESICQALGVLGIKIGSWLV